jgi:hypothetical protein
MAVIMRAAAVISGAMMPTQGFSSLWWLPGTTGGSTADATDILSRFRGCWNGVAAFFDDGLTIDFDPICIAVEATTGVLTGAFVGTDPASVTGTEAGDPLPAQTQGLVRLATSTVVGGRRLRGRIFVPGPAEARNDSSGLPNSTYTSGLTSGFAAMLTAGATASSPVIWHRPTAGAGGTHGLITGVSAAPTWSVLRSRRS